MKQNIFHTEHKYSEKEQKLFDHFGLGHLTKHIDPSSLYRMATQEAFLSNEQSVWADSLRRCIKAFRDMKPNRMTPEWDALIEIPAPPLPDYDYKGVIIGIDGLNGNQFVETDSEDPNDKRITLHPSGRVRGAKVGTKVKVQYRSNFGAGGWFGWRDKDVDTDSK